MAETHSDTLYRYSEYERRLSDLEKDHDKTLYRGNGKPGLVTRMQTCEEKIERMEKRELRREALLYSILATVLAALIMQFVHLK